MANGTMVMMVGIEKPAAVKPAAKLSAKKLKAQQAMQGLVRERAEILARSKRRFRDGEHPPHLARMVRNWDEIGAWLRDNGMVFRNDEREEIYVLDRPGTISWSVFPTSASSPVGMSDGNKSNCMKFGVAAIRRLKLDPKDYGL